MDRRRSQDQLHIVDIIPNRMVCNAREKIALIFNSALPSANQGSYNVAFQGRKRERMEVKAKKINPYTLIVQAPVYNPAEEVRIHVRHVTHEGSKSIGSLPFEFISRDSLMANLLQGCADPVMFMCESLGISPSDMVTLDRALTASFKANMPPGFHLLGLRNEALVNDASKSLYPTLLHFASAFGLFHFVKDCLIHCSGFFEAIALKNCKGKCPSEIAYEGQFLNIYELLTTAEENGEEIYEQMDENNAEEDPYYTAVAGQRVINLHLWRHSKGRDHADDDTDPDGYITTHRTPSDTEEIYTDMESGYDDGYSMTSRQNNEPEDIYTSMESTAEQFESESGASRMEPECDDLYADMESGVEQGETYLDLRNDDRQPDRESFYMNEEEYKEDIGETSPHYQIPCNLPVSRMYPEERSISVSLQSRNDYRSHTAGQKAPAGPPAVPSRAKAPIVPQKPLKPVRPVSITSAASEHSTTSVDSGISEPSICLYDEDDENQFMSREELLNTISKSSKDSQAPPPPPPTDYHDHRPVSPKPRGHRSHHRSKTLPVEKSDVSSAQSIMASRPSVKETRQSPSLSKRMSDFNIGGSRPPAPPPDRRGSVDTLRPPPPIPRSQKLVPTPFVIANKEEKGIPTSFPIVNNEEAVGEPTPCPPPRISSKPQAPTPSPRCKPPSPRY